MTGRPAQRAPSVRQVGFGYETPRVERTRAGGVDPMDTTRAYADGSGDTGQSRNARGQSNPFSFSVNRNYGSDNRLAGSNVEPEVEAPRADTPRAPRFFQTESRPRVSVQRGQASPIYEETEDGRQQGNLLTTLQKRRKQVL